MKANPLYFLFFLAISFFSCNNQPSENNKVITGKPETAQTIQEEKTEATETSANLPEAPNAAENKAEPKPVKRKLKKKVPVQTLPEEISTTLAAATLTEPESEKILTVADIYKHFEKAPQAFTLSGANDTTIICREGTSLKIPANAFVSEKTGEKVSGPVRLLVKEYYQLSDMLLANLSTRSGNNMLETGGMLHLTATSTDNENLALKPDQKIEIGFPYETLKPNMQLFTGDWKEEQMDWKLPQDLKENSGEPYTHVEQMPVFPGGEKGLENYMHSNLKFTVSVLTKGSVRGTTYVQYVVDSTGQVGNIKVYQGGDSAMAKQIVYLISNMPKWKPGIHNGKPVSVSFLSPIRFTVYGGTPEDFSKSSKHYLQAKALETKVQDMEVVYLESETIVSDLTSFGTINSDSVKAKERRFKKEFEAKIDDSSLQQVSVYEANRYLLSTSELGWINCDRFYETKKPKIDYVIKTNGNQNSMVSVVFHSVKAIMPGQTRFNNFQVAKVPIDEKVTIVAFKTEQNKVLLAVKETTIQKAGEKDLIFEPVTMAKLKEEMEKLNRLN